MSDYLLKDLSDENFYHVCTEGLEANVIMIDEEDFRVARNYLALAAWRCGVCVVAFCIMSNHFHILVACKDRNEAVGYIRLLKQLYSTYLRNKYGMNKILKGCNESICLISDIAYLRNCIAYILRNPLAAKVCSKIEDYPWSSYVAYFNSSPQQHQYDIGRLIGRRKRKILKTKMDMTGCGYKLDEGGNISLRSFVRYDVVEKAFKYSGKYFLYQIGCCNDARYEYEFVTKPNLTANDQELLAAAQLCAEKHYRGRKLSDLTIGERCAMLKNLFYNNRSTIPQLARVLGLTRELVRKVLCA